MPIEKPESATYHKKRGTSTLRFKGKNNPSKECIMRGGICWPTSILEGNQERIEGYALIVGKDIRTGTYTIYEESPFVAIDHVTDGEGRIKYRGIAPWFNKCWTDYFCRYFYWRDRSATFEMYMRQLRRSEMIRPKPVLPEIIWDDDSELEHTIAMLALHGKLKADKEGGFFAQNGAYMTNRAVVYPARHALKVCIAGFDQYYWNRQNADYN